MLRTERIDKNLGHNKKCHEPFQTQSKSILRKKKKIVPFIEDSSHQWSKTMKNT